MPVIEAADEADRMLALETAVPWLTDFLCEPHPEVGRDGPVCPFVEPAMRAGTLHITVDRLRAPDHDALAAVVTDMVRRIPGLRETHRNRTLHAIVVVLPLLTEAYWGLLDRVQDTVKPDLAENGFMLGQFHPHCAEPAARNHAFQVARSPVPMLALRYMAFHDILFLHGDARCFAAYQRRFGERYRRSASLDPLLVKTYAEACLRWAEHTT
jgi:hypothetical protein